VSDQVERKKEMQSPIEELEPLRQRISRRKLLKTSATVAIGAAGLGLAACADEADEEVVAPTAADTPEQVATPVVLQPTPGTPAATPITEISLGGDPAGIREVAPGTIFFPYFGNVIALLTNEGIVLIDTSLAMNGAEILRELRKRTDLPVHTIIYTHGHVDHVGGVDHFIDDASERGHPRPRVIGHRRIVDRLHRYELMAGQTLFINSIQFGAPLEPGFAPPPAPVFVYPDVTYDDRTTIQVGHEPFELVHAIGETDDATWVWAPQRNLVCAGDLFVSSCPNVGNPWKVQRYAEGWAEGLEAVADVHPALVLPGHGPPIEGEEAVQTPLLDTARYLRSIHDQVVERMNQGQWLEQILSEVEPPTDLVDKPYLQPIYGHPKFIVRGVWRQYGGWYDGDPADFFSSSTADQSAEMVKLAGAESILARARELQAAGDLPLACHLVDWVRKAEPQNRDAWTLWRDLFQARADKEGNFMARNTFRSAVVEADRHLG
jgi:glyoxylase-like metal-dependent hydrolase (beta-lactamase superfamily II)